jgi:polyisoprenyl-phosphate glycosyltransferase
VKRRPLYVVQTRAGFDRNEAAVAPAIHAVNE